MNMHDRKTTILALSIFIGILLLLTGHPALASDKGRQTESRQQTRIEKIKQVARGAKAWRNVCGSCHNLRDPRELTDAQWDVAVGQMRVRAHLTAQEARDIRAFLKASN